MEIVEVICSDSILVFGFIVAIAIALVVVANWLDAREIKGRYPNV